jgi:hypothetical protein
MAAYIVAVDSPYYATSDRTAASALPSVPAGRYTYHAWRSGAETLSATVAVGDGQPLEVSCVRQAGLALLLLAVLATPRLATAQDVDVSTEVDVTVGRSSEDVRAAGTQLRLFGALPREWRFYAEATWADTWGGEPDEHSDAFGAAYPYKPSRAPDGALRRTDVDLAALAVGHAHRPLPRAVRALQPERSRLHRLLRAPLIRYGGYWALSNNFLETGASVVAGTPRVFGEISLGIPQDEDDLHRVRGFDRVGRVQASVGDVIVGASYIHTQPFKSSSGPTATPSSRASMRAGCAAACSFAANGSTVTRSTGPGPSAATPT